MTNLWIFKMDGSAQPVSPTALKPRTSSCDLGYPGSLIWVLNSSSKNIFAVESDQKSVRSEFIYNPSCMHFTCSLTIPNGRFRGGLQDDTTKTRIFKNRSYHGPPEAGSYPGALLLGAAGESWDLQVAAHTIFQKYFTRRVRGKFCSRKNQLGTFLEAFTMLWHSF